MEREVLVGAFGRMGRELRSNVRVLGFQQGFLGERLVGNRSPPMDKRRLKWTKAHRGRMRKILFLARLGSIWPDSCRPGESIGAYLMILTESGIRPMHRWVLEQKLGRKLRRGEVAHHVNGDTHDNREENLGVMTKVQHALHHYPKVRKNPRWGACGYRHPPGVWSKAFLSCQRCHGTERRHKGHGLCTRCHEQKKRDAHGVTPSG